MKLTIPLSLIAASLAGGCTTTYKWDTDAQGNVHLAGTIHGFDSERVAQVAGTVAGTTLTVAAVAASGYATGYSSQCQQPHGTATGWVNGQFVMINY